MSKTICWSTAFLLIFATTSFTSQISRITLSELYVKSDLIVMAEVVKLLKNGNQDHVTIKADLYLKGKLRKPIGAVLPLSRKITLTQR